MSIRFSGRQLTGLAMLTLVWGLNWPVMKLGVTHYAPLSFRTLSMWIGLPVLWAAIRWTKLQHWEKYGDFSYGVYIFAWPLMMFVCYFGLHEAGMLAYFAVIVVAAHLLAFASWHMIEKPAMSLKDWTPRRIAGRRDPRETGRPASDPATTTVPALAGATTDT